MNQLTTIDPTDVRDRAYARWQARGCPEGSPEQDWLDAERELTGEHVAKLELVPAPSVPAAASPVAAKEVSKRSKPPRPTLKREPVTTRGAKLVPQKPLSSNKRAAG
jgi:hypothetical protein